MFALSAVLVLLTTSGLFYSPKAIGDSGLANPGSSSPATGTNFTPLTLASPALSQASTYGVGLSGAPVVIDANALAQMEGSPPSIANMEKNISEYYVPLGVHLVFLDIFWDNGANTSSTAVAGGRDQAVSDWLSLGVKYQINTIFFLKQFGYFFSSPSWDQSFLNTYPEAQTANGSGVNVPLTAGCSGCTTSSGWTIASPLVYRQYEMDLKQLWLWYGQYSSWIGVGEGATGDRNNYGSIGTAVKSSRPFDNFTMYTYANSVFFQRNINSKTGTYLSDGTPSKIWSMFVNDRPDLVATTGTALTENANYTLFGGNVILQRFYVPFGQTLNGFTLKAMLSTSGSSHKALYETVYRDNASTLIGRPDYSLLVQNESVSGVTGTGAWVSTSFTATLEGGDYYWVAFSTHGGDSSDYYSVSYLQSNVFQDIYLFMGLSGVASATGRSGGSVLWLTNAGGATTTIYPFYYDNSNNWPSSQSTKFQVSSAVKANEITFFTSDREYDPNNVSISIEYPNSTVLLTGQFSVKTFHGDEGLSNSPVQLTCSIHCQSGSSATLVPGITYSVVFGSAPGGDNYAGSIGGGVTQDFLTVTVNPSSAGYLGQTTWPIFSLGLMNLEPQGVSNHEYVSETDLFSSPNYVPGSEIALQFTPSQSGSLQTFSFEVLAVQSNADLFNVTLRSDNEACSGSGNTCSHPMSGSLAPVLAQGTESFAAVNATFKSGPTWSGQLAWVNVTMSAKPHGTLSLTAGTTYWLVIGATNGGGSVLNREINPRAALVYYSSTDFATSWGPPPDGPSDISFQITTSAETISQLVEGQAQVPLGWAAQSFSSPSAFQLKGLWTYVSTSGMYNLNVSIRSDSGSDSPTGTKALASGMIRMNVTSKSQNYVSFNRPVNITAGTKYWFVIQGICFTSNFGSGCSGTAYSFATVYRSDGRSGDYGGTSLHYETSSNGLSWSSPTIEGDLSFILVASTSTITTYNTKALYNEIRAENDQSTANVPAQGWNAFLGSEQSTLMSKLTMMMTGLTDQQAYWFTGLPANVAESSPLFNAKNVIYGDSGAGGVIGCPPSNPSCGGTASFWANDAKDHVINILSAPDQANWLPWSSFGSTLDNRGDLTPTNIQTEYLYGLPITARNILTFNDLSTTVSLKGFYNMTQTQYARSFGTLLNRMEYSGGYFGAEKNAVKVLWIGGSDDGIFPQFLTPAMNVTFVSNNLADQNLTAFGNLEQFNVIVGEPVTPTPSFQARLTNFVSGGGGYIDASFANSPNQQDVFAGLQASSSAASTTSSFTIVKPNKITSPYTSISYAPYWLRYTISNITGQANPAYVLLKDSNNNPVITTHNYGAGIGISIEMPYARLEFSGNSPVFDGVQNGSPRDSFISLLTNAIFVAAHKSNLLPILWETSYNQQQNWSPYLQFSVDGSPGNPVLLWATNNDTSTSPFDIHLNASFYGISTAGWVAINMLNMSVVASGSGSDIHISTTVPAKEWLPIYIMSDSSNLQPIYSTATITSASAGVSTAAYTVTGPQNASSWMVINSAQPVTTVASSKTGPLTPASSLPALNITQIGSACTSIIPSGGGAGGCAAFSKILQQGWFYDQSHQLLYVHFLGGSLVTLSVAQTATSSTSSTSSSVTSNSSTSSTSTVLASSSSSSSSLSSSSSTSTTSTSASTTSSTSSSVTSTNSSSSTLSTTSSATTTSNSTSSQTTSSAAQSIDIVLTPSAVSVQAGSEAQVVVGVVVTGGSPQSVTLNVAGVPAGVSSSLTPSAGTTSFDSVLLLNTSSSATPGTFELSVVGTSGRLTVSKPLELVIDPPVAAPPASYNATISASPLIGGTTNPAPGVVQFRADELLVVTALPSSGWSLEEWLVNGNPAGNGTSLSFIPTGNVAIEAVFSQVAPQAGSRVSVSFTAAGTTTPDLLVDGETFAFPTSFTWAVGSSHQVSAPSLIKSGPDTELVFVGWRGDQNSSSSTLLFTAKYDTAFIADYQVRYLVDFVFVDAGGARVAVQNATIYGPEGLTAVSATNSSAWLKAGATYTPLDGTVAGVVVPVLQGVGNFTASSPQTVTVALSAFPVSIRIVDLFGQPVAGANVTLTISGQERFTQTTGKNGSATFRDVPMGWFAATYSYLGVSGSLSSNVAGPHTNTVTMALSYPVVSVAAVFAGVAAISSVRRWRRNKAADHAFDWDDP